MNLRGVSVNHKTFGEGIIKQYDANYLVVSFSQGEKKFVYPDVFESFISVNDSNIAKFINLEIEKKKRNKIKQQDITNGKKNLVQQKPQQNINTVSKPSFMSECAASWDNIFDLNTIMEDFFPKRETLLTIKSEQANKIKEIVTRRKIEYLVHFTRIDNLNSILKNGLIPVSMQQKMKIPSIRNDDQRIDSTGVALSAFNLKFYEINTDMEYPLENIFQSSKVFERGGPYRDLLNVHPKDAKRDERLKSSGNLIHFNYKDTIWEREPKTIFYDWIYISSLYRNESLSKKILEFNAFTDIEFNQEKSINCQARSAAIFVSLSKLGKLEKVLNNKEELKKIYSKGGNNNTQMSLFDL